jgi:hypothetical protein
LFRRCADEYWRALEAVDEDWDELLQKRWVYEAGYIMLEVVAQLGRCLDLDFYI